MTVNTRVLRPVLIAGGLMLVAGLVAFFLAKPRAPLPPPPAAPELKEYQVGDIADSGRLVFYPDGGAGFELDRDYAFILINVDQSEGGHPQALYRLAINETKEVIDEADWPEFAKVLDKLPPGTVIDRFTTCCMPPWYGLPDSAMGQFYDFCAQRGLVVRDEFHGTCNVICTCPAPGYR